MYYIYAFRPSLAVSWIGTLEDNPEEKPLPVPPAVQLKLKVQEPLKQQGVTMSRLSKPSSRLKGVESGLSEANPSSLKEGPTPAKRSSARMSDLPKKSYKDSDCDTESDGSDNHESGDNCKVLTLDSLELLALQIAARERKISILTSIALFFPFFPLSA